MSGSRPKNLVQDFSEAVMVIEAGRMLVDRGPRRFFWELAVRALPALGLLGSVLPALVLGL
jgi:hypothetical protein